MGKITTSVRGFTLIELMVVITIMLIVTLASYLPYAHHQKKLLVNQAAREISQSLSEARNFALHGLDTGVGNLNVGIYFPKDATEIIYYASPSPLVLGSLDPSDIYKTKKLPRGITVDGIDGVNDEHIFVYSAISGDLTITPSISSDDFDISLSFNKSVSPVLQKQIHYYTQSYISEY